MKRSYELVVPWGIFGAGNAGDEAMLQGFARLLRPDQKATTGIAANNLSHCRYAEPSLSYYKVWRFKRLRRRPLRTATHCAIVGDTPFSDVLGRWPLNELSSIVSAAVRKNLPVAFIGVGTDPLWQPESRPVASRLLQQGRVLSVRSQRDKIRLLELGGDDDTITVTADLAWLCPQPESHFSRGGLKAAGADASRPLIGVSIHPHPRVTRENADFFERLGESLRALIESGLQILPVMTEVRRGEDREAWRQVIREIGDSQHLLRVPFRYRTPQELMALIGYCDAFVGMRYHACLLAALQHVQFVAVAGEGKLEDLCADLEWQQIIPGTSSSIGRLAEIVIGMIQHPAPEDEFRRKVASMKERSRANSHVLQQFLRTSPSAPR